MGERSVRMREAASIALVMAAVVLDAVPGPAIIAVLAALLTTPWRSRKKPRRFTRADLVALSACIAALMLTLLMPDGPLRWLVIGTLIVAYLWSWWLLDPDQ